MFTNSGIQDKKFIHLTQFVGLFIRPEHFLEEPNEENDFPSIKNGPSSLLKYWT